MESESLVAVGAEVSGTAAAIEAAKAGVQVTLIRCWGRRGDTDRTIGVASWLSTVRT